MKAIVCFVLVLLYAIVACKSQEMLSNPHRGERYRTGTFATIKGIAAKNIVKTTHVSDSFDCLTDCMSHPTCQSFNFQTTGNPNHLCELSEIAAVSDPSCQEQRPGYSYFYPIQNMNVVPLKDCSGERVSCKNGGTCVDLGCGGNVCRCQRFNTGKYCEQWTTDISSCKDILNKASYTENRAYTFTIGKKTTDVYCHLTNEICGGGGWTLTMKIDGSTMAQFGYSAALWYNNISHNLTAGQTGFDNYQTKMPSYWAMPLQKLCVGFKVNNVLKWIVVPYSASSLYDVIADGRYRATSIGKATWLSLIGGSSLQPHCNQEGFNNGHTRIGIRSNNEKECSSCDSALGLGMSRYYSCGNYCGHIYCSNTVKQTAAFGYVMIQ